MGERVVRSSPDGARSFSRLPTPIILGEGVDPRLVKLAAINAEASDLLRENSHRTFAITPSVFDRLAEQIEHLVDGIGRIRFRNVSSRIDHDDETGENILVLSGGVNKGRLPLTPTLKNIKVRNNQTGTGIEFVGESIKLLQRIFPGMTDPDKGMREGIGEALGVDVLEVSIGEGVLLAKVEKRQEQQKAA